MTSQWESFQMLFSSVSRECCMCLTNSWIFNKGAWKTGHLFSCFSDNFKTLGLECEILWVSQSLEGKKNPTSIKQLLMLGPKLAIFYLL